MKRPLGVITVSIFLIVFMLPVTAYSSIRIILPKDKQTVPAYTSELLVERLVRLSADTVTVGARKAGALNIELRIDPKLSSALTSEGYKIETTKKNALITSASGNGLLYGSCRFIEWVMGQTTPDLVDRTQIDIDFPVKPGQASVFLKNLPSWRVQEKPFYPLRSFELSNLALGVADLIKTDKNTVKYNDYSKVSGPFIKTVETWKTWCNWLARHRMNIISNWPYSAGTNWWELANDPATEGMTVYSKEEIDKAAQVRENLLKYARSRGLRPYLMNYVAGAPTNIIKQKHPEMIGEKFNPNYPEPFSLSSPVTIDLFSKQMAAIARTYPSLEGFHLRWWGESFSDPRGGQAKLEELTLAMMNAAREERSDISFIMSGYFRMKGTKEYANRMPQSVIIQSKWGADWEPVPDPAVPFDRISELNRPFLISQGLPGEEFHSVGGVQYRSLRDGILKYANASEKVKNLAGFATVTGEKDHEWITETNYLTMARMNWDPKGTDVPALIRNYISTHYGPAAVAPVYQALELTQDASEKFVVDFDGVCFYVDCSRTHSMFGTRRVSGLSLTELDKGLALVGSHADMLAKAVNLLKQVESKVEAQGRESFSDLMIQTRWYADFYASRMLMVQAFIDKRNGNIDAMAEKLKKLKEMDQALLQLAMSKPNISDDFEMEGMTQAVRMEDGCLAEANEISAMLEPANLISLKQNRELFAEQSALSATGKVGDKFPVSINIPADVEDVEEAKLVFIAQDLDGTKPGEEGVVTILGKIFDLPLTGNGKELVCEFAIEPASLRPGKVDIVFLLVGKPEGTSGYLVRNIRLMLKRK